MIFFLIYFRPTQIMYLYVLTCENCCHFFMECLLYDNIRRNVPVILKMYDYFLYENTELSIDQTKDIFGAVQVSLIDSNRFG